MAGLLPQYSLGDLLWAKIGSYPWWPSIISFDPQSATYFNEKGNIFKIFIYFSLWCFHSELECIWFLCCRIWIIQKPLKAIFAVISLKIWGKITPPPKKKNSHQIAYLSNLTQNSHFLSNCISKLRRNMNFESNWLCNLMGKFCFRSYFTLNFLRRKLSLRYHIIDVRGVLENSVLGAYNSSTNLITYIEQS